MTSQPSTLPDSTSHKSQWTLPTILTVACLGVGAWAVPQYAQSQQLEEDSTHEITVAAPISPAAPSASGSADASALKKELDSIANGFSAGNISGIVMDAQSGEVLYSRNSNTARIPASNFKILTDYALLRTENPYARYSTSVVQKDSSLTLKAGGDTLLSPGKSDDSKIVGRAGLKTLAEDTVAALKDGEQKKFTVNRDTSMYTGPDINPAWAQEDIDAGFVNRISAMAFLSHYNPTADNQASTTRPSEPALKVHQRFVDELNAAGKSAGLSFTLGDRTSAPEEASEVASVESATVAEQAGYMMRESDNMLAEALARNAAVAAGKEGSFENAKTLVRETLEKDGILTEGLKQDDLCGLSMKNRVTNETLAQVIRAMVRGENNLSAGLDGFPVAGGSGTLATRFDDKNEAGARGYARAKTGTLNKVISLSGYTENANGQVLIYSFITNDLTDVGAAKNTVDASVATVTGRNK